MSVSRSAVEAWGEPCTSLLLFSRHFFSREILWRALRSVGRLSKLLPSTYEAKLLKKVPNFL